MLKMRAIFMGTDEFAVPALKATINAEVELVCVITQPDRRKGRGMKSAPSPVKEVALENGLPLYQPERVCERDFVEEVLRESCPDIVIVSAFGQILSEEVLAVPPRGCVNLHPSLLPSFRGAAPIQRAIMNGESVTGVTVMFMDAGEDTGDVILQQRMDVEMSDTAETLSRKLSALSGLLLGETLCLALVGPLHHTPQNHAKASYAPKLKREDGLIDWKSGALEIHNLIRGTIPWPGAYTTFGGGANLKVWESQPLGLPTGEARPGTIIDILPGKGILVATGDMSLALTAVQPANKSKMGATSFVNGYRIRVGDEFL